MRRQHLRQWITWAIAVAIVGFIFAGGLWLGVADTLAQEADEEPTPLPEIINTDALRQILGEQEGLPIGQGEKIEATPEPAEQESPAVLPPAEDEHATYLEAQRRLLAQERQSLEAMKDELRKELTRLETLRNEIDSRLEQEDAQTQAKINRLVKIYESMRPDDLVKVLDNLDEKLRLQVLMRMKQKIVSQVLTRMEPSRAAAISKKLMEKKLK